MAKTIKKVDSKNIISGPCRSFKLGEREVGGTEEGVEVEFGQEFEEHAVDESTDAIMLEPTSTQMIIKTSFAEATLENLKVAWNQASAIVADPTAKTETLNIGINAPVIEYPLEFIGPGPAGKERTYKVHRAIQMSASSHSVRKGNKVVFPVEFRVLPKTDLPENQQYGSVTDKVITEGA
jgi:hypothetical protein